MLYSAKLKEPWHLTTWLSFSEFINDLEFSNKYSVIINHFRGFSEQYLERGANMKLTFEKIAFLKAYWEIGNECGKTLDYLVSPIEKLLKESPLSLTDVKKQQLYNKSRNQSYSSTLYKRDRDEVWVTAVTAMRPIFTGKHYAKSGTTASRQAISEISPSKKLRSALISSV